MINVFGRRKIFQTGNGNIHERLTMTKCSPDVRVQASDKGHRGRWGGVGVRERGIRREKMGETGHIDW